MIDTKFSSCNAIINVYTYKTLPNFKELVELALKYAPKITGDTGNCNYTIVDLQKGQSDSFPCKNCPIYEPGFKGKLKTCCPGYFSNSFSDKDKEECFIQNLPFEFQLDISEYYDTCKIVISDMQGLGYKEKEKTISEFNTFIDYLKNVYKGIFNVEIVCREIY